MSSSLMHWGYDSLSPNLWYVGGVWLSDLLAVQMREGRTGLLFITQLWCIWLQDVNTLRHSAIYGLSSYITLYYFCINELVQERYNSSALAMELRLSCPNPSIWNPVLLICQNLLFFGKNVFCPYFRNFVDFSMIGMGISMVEHIL